MVALAAAGSRLRFTELGAGSAEKTRLLLKAALARQANWSMSRSTSRPPRCWKRRSGLSGRFPAFVPRVGWTTPTDSSSMPASRASGGWCSISVRASATLSRKSRRGFCASVRKQLDPGDSLLLGVDLVKDESTLLAAYDDAAGVTAAFNRNMLVRLNRELGADFDLDAIRASRSVERDQVADGDASGELHRAARASCGSRLGG